MLLLIDSPVLPAGGMLLHELRDDDLTGRFHVRHPVAKELRRRLSTSAAGRARAIFVDELVGARHFHRHFRLVESNKQAGEVQRVKFAGGNASPDKNGVRPAGRPL